MGRRRRVGLQSPSRRGIQSLDVMISCPSLLIETTRNLRLALFEGWVKSDSISTDSVSINEKNELKDNMLLLASMQIDLKYTSDKSHMAFHTSHLLWFWELPWKIWFTQSHLCCAWYIVGSREVGLIIPNVTMDCLSTWIKSSIAHL